MSCNDTKLTELKCEFANLVYSKYQNDAYSLKACQKDYNPIKAKELMMKIDLLSHCTVFKCKIPD